MINLIKTEMYKLIRNKTFWVLIVSFTGLSVLLHCLILTDWWFMSGTEFDEAGLSELNALSPFKTLLFFNLIVSTLAGYYISTEFSQSNVIKNQMMSGNKRTTILMSKYLTFSFGSWIVVIMIPLATGLILVHLLGFGDIFTLATIIYLGRAYSLFILHFLSFTAIVLLIAIVTEDSGKTIIFTLLLSIMMFVIEKFSTLPFINKMYEHTFFYQLNEAFKVSITSGEMIKSILIGIVSLGIVMLCGIFIINRKEIK